MTPLFQNLQIHPPPVISHSEGKMEVDVGSEGHHFRYLSEVDPRKKQGKGGELQGSLHLPDNLQQPCILRISPYPAFEYSDPNLISCLPGIESFQPCVLHLIRKKGRTRLFDREEIPSNKSRSLEFWIENNHFYYLREDKSGGYIFLISFCIVSLHSPTMCQF